MKLLVPLLLAAAGAIPLIVLVTRADRKRRAIETLRAFRDHGLVTQEDFDRRAHEILSRSCWIPVLIALLSLTGCSTATRARKDDRIWQMPVGVTPEAEKKNRPNKALEPTTTSVTSPAIAGAAPAAVVAHL